MPWPTVPVVTTGMDADTDTLPRTDILDHAQKFNQLIAMRAVADGVCDLDSSALIPSARLPAVYQPLDAQLTTLADITAQQATDLAAVSTFMGTVLNDTTADAAKATLEVGIQAKAVNGYSASATLPTSEFGSTLYYNSTSAGTLTLPAATGNIGKIITIYNLSTGVCTVARSGTEVIYAQGLNGAVSITLNSGEGTQLYSDNSSWIQVGGTKSTLRSGTAVASTSGTSIDFTGIPAGTKRITVMFNGVSTSGTALVRFQLGDAGGIENTGYLGSSSFIGGSVSTVTTTAGFDIQAAEAAALREGSIVFTRLNAATFHWTAMGVFSTGAGCHVIAGSKPLSAELTQLRITTSNGTDTFDAGSINILYE